MNISMNASMKKAISRYIQGKDHNKPHLLKQAFAQHATLSMQVKTENISFPSNTRGLAAISQLLVSDFNKQYENIYTYCITDTFREADLNLSCSWLVVMTEKATGKVRLGFGDYHWSFTHSGPHLLADRLEIIIDAMNVLDEEAKEPFLVWAEALPYPYLSLRELLSNSPAHVALEALEAKLLVKKK
ncbi:hypothetical protein [uncultured Pseudoteredinibacter sp.]|uniref:hypothetical protein n=1 Tax=uncultured Pseudoteredinibacter sp. TaxID=1641701 RepID=UPI002603579B|nr:hypothetical protein [uncultured Pseudoteredinibacter sp.]